ncbi:unnamed protein product [marine sediment metagenome]|uniref:Uncharacterized protein n=1 Tax=marine sediment metagenome TaxID=412755 RepID=X0WTR3_9ZZZZ
MIVKEYCEPFLDKIVNIGVPHHYLDRLFFITGKLLEVNDDHLILRKKDGIQQIQLKDIIEISLNQED